MCRCVTIIERRQRVRQEDDYQVVVYSPSVSREDLSTIVDYDCSSDYGGSQDTVLSADGMPSVVINDEFTMIEGAAICMYLADLYGQFVPTSEHRAEYYRFGMGKLIYCYHLAFLLFSLNSLINV